MNTTVSLEIPARADQILLARIMAAAVGSRAEFNVEEIDDLRLAVGELCVWLMGEDDDDRLALTFRSQDDLIEVTCRLLSDVPRPQVSHLDSDGLSATIVSALVDECGDAGDGIWFRKHGGGRS